MSLGDNLKPPDADCLWAWGILGSLEKTRLPEQINGTWSERRESNPHHQLGKLEFYH